MNKITTYPIAPSYMLTHISRLKQSLRPIDKHILNSIENSIIQYRDAKVLWNAIRKSKNQTKGKEYDRLLEREYKRKLDTLVNHMFDFYALPNVLQSEVCVEQKTLFVKTYDIALPNSQSIVNMFKDDAALNKQVYKVGHRTYLFDSEVNKCVDLLSKIFLLNAERNGFKRIHVPAFISQENLFKSGHYPKFKDDMFTVDSELYLIPTSEVSILSFAPFDLAKNTIDRFCCYSACFRREAGNAKDDNFPLKRLHQFHKLELFSFVDVSTNDQASYIEHNHILNTALQILDLLQINHRAVLLAADDTSFASTKTIDIEIYLPNTQIYIEVSSCSNCGDFQSFRSKIKGAKGKIHTLNGTGLAIERILIYLIEAFGSFDKVNQFLVKKLLELDSNQQPND